MNKRSNDQQNPEDGILQSIHRVYQKDDINAKHSFVNIQFTHANGRSTSRSQRPGIVNLFCILQKRHRLHILKPLTKTKQSTQAIEMFNQLDEIWCILISRLLPSNIEVYRAALIFVKFDLPKSFGIDDVQRGHACRWRDNGSIMLLILQFNCQQ